VKKIAVLRANALGDYIFILPALQALKERFPNSEIVLLGKNWHKDYLMNRPGPVDRVIVVPPYPGVGENESFQPDPETLNAFFSEMEKEEFDIAFQLHGGGRNSNPFLSRLGAKVTVGLRTPDAPELDISVPYVYYFSEILRYLEVVEKVGATTSSRDPVIAVTENDLAEAEKKLGDFGSQRYVVVHPGASDRRRRWPATNFAQITDFLIDQGYTTYLTGTPSESADVEQVISACKQKDKVINLCGSLSLNAMTGLLSKAELIVSNDTGPLHLARALKRPTVGIYWAGNIVTGLSMVTSIHRSIPSFSFNCPLCGLPASKMGTEDPGTCKHDTSFVADVQVKEVKSALKELIDFHNRQGQASNLEKIKELKFEEEQA